MHIRIEIIFRIVFKIKKFINLKYIERIIKKMFKETEVLEAIELYKQKKISLGLASKLSGLSLSEFLDLLEEFNIKINFTLDDAREAMRNAEKLI